MPRSGIRSSESVTTATSSSTGPPSAVAAVRQRKEGAAGSPGPIKKAVEKDVAKAEEKLGVETRQQPTMSLTARNQWIVYAVASGACAAFNGVFAKLTTNDLTTHISEGISKLLGLEGIDRVLEIIIRCIFFGLNLAFNGVMWTLFTQALAKGNSTTQVSIMNTSTNFMITALLGFAIFAESLPPLWWVGATLLVAGNVIIGRKDESSSTEDADTEANEQEEAAERGALLPEEKSDDEDEDVPLLGDLDGSPDR
ncbi:hypothetical protein HD806DRAFT_515018 [Xylariaceae sp. AK1471]|nr:hypothetical protein HD806DRAFT_515018 [Xylariaceae sp. AK1471]